MLVDAAPKHRHAAFQHRSAIRRPRIENRILSQRAVRPADDVWSCKWKQLGEQGLVDIASDANRMIMRRFIDRLIAEESRTQAAE